MNSAHSDAVRADETHVHAIDQHGFAVVPSVLDADMVARCGDALDEVFEAEGDIAEARRWLTTAYRVAYMLPAKHSVFLDLCRPGRLTALSAAVLGDDCVIAGFNGQSMIPGGEGQPLHRDHAVQTPGVTLYLHSVVALDRFNITNGATRLVPGSHRDALRGAEPASMESHARHVELEPGDAVVFDATCVHAGSANTSTRPRRALHVFFARRWVQPHWDFPGSLRPHDADGLDAERRRLLGFGNVPARYDHAARRSFGYGWG